MYKLILIACLISSSVVWASTSVDELTIASNGSIDSPIVSSIPGMPIDGYNVSVSTSVSQDQ